MSEPQCLGCHMETLTDDERQRLAMEPTTGCIFYCPKHQRVIDFYTDKIRIEEYVQRKDPLKIMRFGSGA